MQYVYVVTSEALYGAEVCIFSNLYTAKIYIKQEPNIKYRIHKFNNPETVDIYTCVLAKMYTDKQIIFPLKYLLCLIKMMNMVQLKVKNLVYYI